MASVFFYYLCICLSVQSHHFLQRIELNKIHSAGLLQSIDRSLSQQTHIFNIFYTWNELMQKKWMAHGNKKTEVELLFELSSSALNASAYSFAQPINRNVTINNHYIAFDLSIQLEMACCGETSQHRICLYVRFAVQHNNSNASHAENLIGSTFFVFRITFVLKQYRHFYL